MSKTPRSKLTVETLSDKDSATLLRTSNDEHVQHMAGMALHKRTDPSFLPRLKHKIVDRINGSAVKRSR